MPPARGSRQPARPEAAHLARSDPPFLYCSAESSWLVDSSRKRSSWFPENVADTSKRVQKPLLAGVDLSAKVGYIGLDDVDVATEVVAPYVIEDLGLGQHR